MIRPGFTLPIAFLIGITIWLIFLRDPPATTDNCTGGPRFSHQSVASFGQCR